MSEMHPSGLRIRVFSKFFVMVGQMNPVHFYVSKAKIIDMLVSIGDTSRSGSNSSSSCSGREIHEGCLRRSITRKPMVSFSGETPPTKVVAIEPILGSIKYEARCHDHSVFSGDHIHSRVPQCSVKSPFISVREIMMVACSSSRKWGVTRFQQV